ncbi:uncharacterized protein M437DRAFT_80004 [Aureobasidium melanogenum CBS 110374]|uniref:Uncharacterized protein n=1 Tax=Aureobasidium melanogenum (strain CBS 110374) TaxID=1043003 RepID=A0A074W6Z8_AURM1|nr:uncharacterized protein M437DRAFT_80004 [Aureobasidium melanogenum CBS 110374]KEQ67354.1 hypothetical protein M437DRAFT_80004 [Aureobasidium melanogenum CBS 110374]
MGATRDTARTLSMVVSSLILMYHATTAYLCTFLTSDPLYVSFSVTAYAWYGCVLAMLGIYGSFKKSPTHLTIFSNHLLIDTILSLVPKIGLVYLFHDVTSDLCFTSKLNTSFWFPSTTADLHGPGRVIQTSSPEQTLGASIKARRHCETDVLIAQIAFGAVLVFWTIAQWGMGLSVRRYALKLELHNHQADQCVDEEKAFYKEESLADEYEDAVKNVQRWTRGEKDSATFIEVAEKPS